MKDRLIKLLHTLAVLAAIYLAAAPGFGLPVFDWMQHVAGMTAAQQTASASLVAGILLRVHFLLIEGFGALSGIAVDAVAIVKDLFAGNAAAAAQAEADMEAKIAAAVASQMGELTKAVAQTVVAQIQQQTNQGTQQ